MERMLWWLGSPGPPLLLLQALLLLQVPTEAAVQDHSGTRFVLAFIENRFLVDRPIPKVFVTAAEDSVATVTVSFPPNYIQPAVTLTVTPGTGAELALSSDLQLREIGFDFDRVVMVESDVAVVVQAASLNDLSSDAFLVLPTPSLGTEYVVMSYVFTGRSTGQQQGPSSVAIIALEVVDLRIEFTNIEDVNTQGIERYLTGGNVLEVNLHQYDVFQVRSKYYRELTGSRITASGPISIIAGSLWTSVGKELMGDHLVENLPPVTTWGTVFYTVPVANRTSGDVIRVLGYTNQTQLRVIQANPDDPGSVLVNKMELNDRLFVDIESQSNETLVILASRQVLVAQFCKSHSVDNNRYSDPFMALLPPSSQYTNTYHFITISTRTGQTSFNNFLNIVCETDKMSGLRLNGLAIANGDLHWGWAPIVSSSMSAGILAIPNGTYSLLHIDPNVGFSAMLYGLKWQESYGMLLGQRLRTLTYKDICTPVPVEYEDYFDNDCDGYFDEEIDNGIDDDGDGLIDEDVFNDKMARNQGGSDNRTLYTGAGNDVLLPTTEEMTTSPAVETTTMDETTTIEITTIAETTQADTTTSLPTTTEYKVTTEETTTVQETTTNIPTTTVEMTTEMTTTEPVTTEMTSTEVMTTERTTTEVETTVMTTTEQITTEKVTTEITTTELATTELTTTEEMTTESLTTPAITSTAAPTTEERETTMVTTTTEEITTPEITTTEEIISTIPTTVEDTTTMEATTTAEPPSTPSETTIVTTEATTETTTEKTTFLETTPDATTTDEVSTKVTTEESTTADVTTTVPPLQQTTTILEILSTALSSSDEATSEKTTETIETTENTVSPTTSRSKLQSTKDPNSRIFTTSSITLTTEQPVLETSTQPPSVKPSSEGFNLFRDDPLMIVIPFAILIGIPLLAMAALVVRSIMAGRKKPKPPSDVVTSAPPPPPVANARKKPVIVDLR